MNIHIINLALDFLFGGLAAYRIHRGSLLESGTLLRLGVLLLAVWRGFGDVHEITGWFDWGVTLHSLHFGPFRDMVSEMILFIAMSLDLLCDIQRGKSQTKIQTFIEEVRKGG